MKCPHCGLFTSWSNCKPSINNGGLIVICGWNARVVVAPRFVILFVHQERDGIMITCKQFRGHPPFNVLLQLKLQLRSSSSATNIAAVAVVVVVAMWPANSTHKQDWKSFVSTKPQQHLVVLKDLHDCTLLAFLVPINCHLLMLLHLALLCMISMFRIRP